MAPSSRALRLGPLVERSRANGPGERCVLWFQGCTLACLGCFNPELWVSRGGTCLTAEALATRIHAIPGVRGVTLTGGEPLEQAEGAAELLRLLSPDLDRVIFTGFTFEEIAADPHRADAIALADLVVAGRYRREAASDSPWAGSANKDVRALTGRIGIDEGPENRIEVQIGPDGDAWMTGFPSRALRTALRPSRKPRTSR